MVSIVAMSQKDIYLYRTYLQEDNSPERIAYEFMENKKTGIRYFAFYFSSEAFSKEYLHENGKLMSIVNENDSSYYEYFNNDSAIVYSISEGIKRRNNKLIFNKKEKVILDIGYLYNSFNIATITRNTYQADTLLIGSADFNIMTLWDNVDTSQTDSSFQTYDKSGKLTGEYKVSRDGEIDSMLITEYSHTDTTQTMWGYEKVDNHFVKYKRCVDFYDKDQNLITRLYYRFSDIYEGKTEYTYEDVKGKSTKITKTIRQYRTDGSISNTKSYRWEVIER